MSNRLEVGKSFKNNDFIKKHFANNDVFGCGSMATVGENGQIVICHTPLCVIPELIAHFQFGLLKFYDYTCRSGAHVLLIRGAVNAELYIDPEAITENGIEMMMRQFSSLLILADDEYDKVGALRYIEIPVEVKEFIKKEYYAAKKRNRKAFLDGSDEVGLGILFNLESRARLIGTAKNVANVKRAAIDMECSDINGVAA